MAKAKSKTVARKRRSKASPASSAVKRRTRSVTTRSTKSAASVEGSGGARTIIYVHGIGNKPPADILKCQWDEALFGFNLGERSRLAYWVNRIFYPEPTPATCKMADSVQDTGGLAGDVVGARALAVAAGGVDALLPPDAHNAKQRAVLSRLAARALAAPELGELSAADFHARVLPLPKPIREFVSRRITKAWLKDVNEFLFVKERRDAMRKSVLDRIGTGGGPFIVIGHSQGSMVAYEALCGLSPGEAQVDLFVTIGSPLGLKEVQDQIKVFTNQPKGLATPAVVKRWINVADPLDPVCADKRLRSDYAATNGVRVEDFLRFNADSPRDPHSGTGYLSLPAVREAMRETIDRALFQRIAPFTLSRDLVNDMERFTPDERHTVLIELRDEFPKGEERSLDDVRARVVRWIDEALKATSPRLDRDDVELERLSGYVSAKLTRSEVERLSTDLQIDSVYRVFRNARKRALLDQSINVLQCSTAHRGYDSKGQGIHWAVLDTGIDPRHPHFAAAENVAAVYDCLKPGDIRAWNGDEDSDIGYDGNGHGTHVAGIIAGGMPEPVGICGIAPSVKLHSYRVLDDEGSGSDAKIIKALDHIYDTNRNSSSLVIHGVNLSLGGPFDPESFGCGDTPICKQLRKLWRQGVVVVLAAGNEGYLELQQGEEVFGVNTDLSIGDPANLEESIAVGSIHKSKPHLYGVSYFSSRGPTADGRPKPDLVAPGERILSCRAGANPKTRLRNNLYVAMSGTSMAAPHVSGVIACFLSVRKEFIGYPERVKEMLLGSCTNLKRDPLHQGAGMPNLVKMLLGS
jgi:subtilisin family serine protease